MAGGDIYGIVHENTLVQHKMMLPPKAQGYLKYLAPEGYYDVEDVIIETEYEGEVTKHTMMQVNI